jgi:hypothetical protein
VPTADIVDAGLLLPAWSHPRPSTTAPTNAQAYKAVEARAEQGEHRWQTCRALKAKIRNAVPLRLAQQDTFNVV